MPIETDINGQSLNVVTVQPVRRHTFSGVSKPKSGTRKKNRSPKGQQSPGKASPFAMRSMQDQIDSEADGTARASSAPSSSTGHALIVAANAGGTNSGSQDGHTKSSSPDDSAGGVSGVSTRESTLGGARDSVEMVPEGLSLDQPTQGSLVQDGTSPTYAGKVVGSPRAASDPANPSLKRWFKQKDNSHATSPQTQRVPVSDSSTSLVSAASKKSFALTLDSVTSPPQDDDPMSPVATRAQPTKEVSPTPSGVSGVPEPEPERSECSPIPTFAHETPAAQVNE